MFSDIFKTLGILLNEFTGHIKEIHTQVCGDSKNGTKSLREENEKSNKNIEKKVDGIENALSRQIKTDKGEIMEILNRTNTDISKEIKENGTLIRSIELYLTGNLKSSQENLSDKIETNETLIKNLDSYLKDDVVKSQKAKEEAERKNAALEQEKQGLSSDIDSLKSDLSESNGKIESNLKEIKEKRDKIDENEKEIQEKDKKISNLKETSDECEKSISSFKTVFESDKIMNLLNSILKCDSLNEFRKEKEIVDKQPQSILNLVKFLGTPKGFIGSYYDSIERYKKENQEKATEKEIVFYKSVNNYFEGEEIIKLDGIESSGKFNKSIHKGIDGTLSATSFEYVLIPNDLINSKMKVKISQ